MASHRTSELECKGPRQVLQHEGQENSVSKAKEASDMDEIGVFKARALTRSDFLSSKKLLEQNKGVTELLKG